MIDTCDDLIVNLREQEKSPVWDWLWECLKGSLLIKSFNIGRHSTQWAAPFPRQRVLKCMSGDTQVSKQGREHATFISLPACCGCDVTNFLKSLPWFSTVAVYNLELCAEINLFSPKLLFVRGSSQPQKWNFNNAPVFWEFRLRLTQKYADERTTSCPC